MRLPPLARRATVLVAATAALAAAAPAQSPAARPTSSERQLMRAVNDVRRAHGLRPVRLGPRLQRGAHRFAHYLRRTDGFHHSSLSASYENLAYGRVTRRMARHVVRLWMASPSHRANVLRRGMRAGGFGISRGEFLGHGRMQMSVARFR